MDNWISVEDRLPDNGMYLTCWNNGDIETYEMEDNDTFGWEEKLTPSLWITHWQPLPAPPKEEG